MTKLLNNPALMKQLEEVLDRHVDDRIMHAVLHRLATVLEPHLKS